MNNAATPQVRALKPHVGLNVSNLDASVAFYRNLFGIEPVRLRRDYAKFDVDNPPLNLTMNLHPPTGNNVSHLGIQVSTTEDVVSIRDSWASRGLAPLDEMGTQCCYALQDKSWVTDPDGNEWEVFAVLNADTENTTECCGPATRAENAEMVEETAACCEEGGNCC